MERNPPPDRPGRSHGAGKSAVARVLASRLGGAAADLDALVEARAEASVAELFSREGEAGFRRRESQALADAIESGAAVVATGGGVVLDPANRVLLEARCQVVWLEVTPEEAARRLESDSGSRPLLAPGPIEARGSRRCCASARRSTRSWRT